MGKTYPAEDTIEKLEKALRSPDRLYKESFVNWSGRSRGGGEYYTELLAARLLKDDTLNTYLGGIVPIRRSRTYCTPSHQVGCERGRENESNRREEILAKSITNVHPLGEVRGYQVPLKDKQSNKGAGKIDLVVKGEDALWLVELKYLNKGETLLRCALEISTYFQQVNREKLCEDFGLSPNLPTGKAVAVDRQCLAFDEFVEMQKGERPQLQTLLKRLTVRVVHFDLPSLGWVDVKIYDP
jgi:hypothetical protein